jgi:membrane protease YdiL (CAAX protease family)
MLLVRLSYQGGTMTSTLAREQRSDRVAPGLLVGAAGIVLASGVLSTLPATAPGRIAVGVAATAGLIVLAALAGLGRRLRPAREGLLVFAALSVFGWASAAVTAVPAVDHLLRTAPVPVAFLLANALKLTAVLPLLALARRRPGVREAWLLRAGNPRAGTGIPHLSWPVAGPVVIVVVLALFLTALPAAAFGHLGAAVRWLPVLLLGPLVNAVCEELLYRHAAIGATRAVLGTVPAVVLTSVVFGLGHLTGNPGGLAGVLYTTGYGAVCAAAMLRTRGACWNVPIHVAGDFAIVLTLFLGGLRAV